MSTHSGSSVTRREFQQRLLQLAALGAAGPWLPGCTQTRDEITPGKPSTSGAAPLTIGLIAKSNSNPVFLAGRKGAESKAAELTKDGKRTFKIDWRTPNDEDAQKQAEFIEQLVASGAHGIAIACSDASKVTRAIDAAIEKGVHVMCFDSDAPESKRMAYVGTDDFGGGKAIMEEVIDLLGDKEGSVAILAGNQTATNLQKRVAGAKEVLAKQSKLKLQDVFYHKETPQDSLATVESVQKAHPEIVGWAMIGGWPLMTERALPWEPGSVICVAMDTLKPQLSHLRRGDVQVLYGQQYFYWGSQCVTLLADAMLEGKKPEKEIDLAPLTRVTKENVDEYEKNWELWS